MTIQNIIEKFDKEFVKDLGEKVEPVFKDPNGCVGPIRYFIQSSLTELLDSVLEKLPKEQDLNKETGDYLKTDDEELFKKQRLVKIASNVYRQEVINIINSHK